MRNVVRPGLGRVDLDRTAGYGQPRLQQHFFVFTMIDSKRQVKPYLRILEKMDFYDKESCFVLSPLPLSPLMTSLETNLGRESHRFQKCFGTLA